MRVMTTLAVKIAALKKNDEPVARPVNTGEVEYLTDRSPEIAHDLLREVYG